MIIAGLQKTTLVDFPGRVAATVFTRGCSFRCPFCHNPELVLPEKFNPVLSLDSFWSFLAKRRGKIEGVCITGGEPMMHPDIIDFMKKIKEMGFLIKLDTNGSFPDRLDQAIKEKAMDYIAMDIKGPIARYEEIARPTMSLRGLANGEDVAIPSPSVQQDPSVPLGMTSENKIERSIDLIMNSGIPYEFRTTFFKPLLSLDDIPAMGEMIRGADKYYIQNFVYSKHNDEELVMQPFSDVEIARVRVIMSQFVKEVKIR